MSSSQTSSSAANNSSDFFQRLSQQKEETPQQVRKSTRLITGLIIGASLGLVYGLVTQTINSIFTPGVPYAQYPFGLAGNLIASIVVWTVVGGLCATPHSAIVGAVVGSLTTAVIVTLLPAVVMVLTEAGFIQFMMASANLFFFIIAALVSLPLMLLVRWAIEVQGELALQPLWSWRRLRAPLAALLLLGVVAGVLTLSTEDVRQAMTELHLLIERGLTASRADELPSAFKSDRVDDFLANATRSYTLEQSTNANVLHDISLVIDTDFNTSPLLLARFSNGWLLACLVSPQTSSMRCKSYTALPE